MAGSHLLICLHDACQHAMYVPAGDLPTRCPECRQHGFWRIDRVMVWSVKDLRLLRVLGISPE